MPLTPSPAALSGQCATPASRRCACQLQDAVYEPGPSGNKGYWKFLCVVFISVSGEQSLLCCRRPRRQQRTDPVLKRAMTDGVDLPHITAYHHEIAGTNCAMLDCLGTVLVGRARAASEPVNVATAVQSITFSLFVTHSFLISRKLGSNRTDNSCSASRRVSVSSLQCSARIEAVQMQGRPAVLAVRPGLSFVAPRCLRRGAL